MGKTVDWNGNNQSSHGKNFHLFLSLLSKLDDCSFKKVEVHAKNSTLESSVKILYSLESRK